MPTRAIKLPVYQTVGCARKPKRNRGNGRLMGEQPSRGPNYPKADVFANAPVRLHGKCVPEP